MAVVGDRQISRQAFEERYATLLRKTGMADNLLARQRVLETLINEEVLLAGAEELGLPDTPAFRLETRAIEEQVLLDQFRKVIVSAEVEVSDAEIREAYARLNTRVTARHLFAETKEEALRLRSLLMSGMTFEELAATTFRDPELAANGGLVGTFTFGEMDPAFEEVAFSLPVGEISQPVRTQHGYSIIRVEDRVRQPILSEWQYQRRKGKIAAYLRRIKSRQEAVRFTREVADRLQIGFQMPVLRLLADRIAAMADSFSVREEGGSDSDPLLDALADLLSQPLVRFHGGSWTVAEFLEEARWTSARQQARVRSLDDLQEFVRGLVVRDYLLAEARRRGVHRRPDTRALIARQVRNLTLRQMRQHLTEGVTVPDSAQLAWYESHRRRYVDPEQVNVREILVGSEAEARDLLAQIRSGADFAALARRHSLRTWAAERGGELGFAPAGRYGQFADRVFAAEVGELIGPLQVGDYFSIMRVLARKPERQKRFDEVRQQIESELLWEWQQRSIDQYVQLKRQQLGVTLDESLLATVAAKKWGG